LIIQEKSSGHFIGYAAVMEKLDRQFIALGYGIRSDFRNQGFATETARTLFRAVQQRTDQHALVVIVHKMNAPSIAVIEKLKSELGLMYLDDMGDQNFRYFRFAGKDQ